MGHRYGFCFCAGAFRKDQPAGRAFPRRTCPNSTKSFRMLSHTDADIHSLRNQRVKDARALLRRRQREKEGKILLEGHRLISDAVDAGVAPQCFFYTKAALDRNKSHYALRDVMRHKGADDLAVTESVIRSLSDTVNPQVSLCDAHGFVFDLSPGVFLLRPLRWLTNVLGIANLKYRDWLAYSKDRELHCRQLLH